MILGWSMYLPFFVTQETITGTASITLGNFTASASDSTGLSPGLRLSQALSTTLSDSLSIG